MKTNPRREHLAVLPHADTLRARAWPLKELRTEARARCVLVSAAVPAAYALILLTLERVGSWDGRVEPTDADLGGTVVALDADGDFIRSYRYDKL